MSNEQECRFCGKTAFYVCRNNRDMKDAAETRCYAALLFHGGGSDVAAQILSAELIRRAGLKRETGS